jgi:mono/diheme cytochrome c family protein
MARRILLAACVAAAASLGAGCGSASVQLPKDDANHAGAAIFAERCGACHTLDVVGTQGSATDVADREREDGPNFNDRQERVSDVLFAIENGGFSGAIMPENIVTGEEARQVATFLAKYAGKGGSSPALGPESSGGG